MTERTCSVEGCEHRHFGRGYCNAHYKRWRKTGEAGSPDVVLRAPTRTVVVATCVIDNCGSRVHGDGLCPKHYQRARNHGDAEALRRQCGQAHHQWKGPGVSYVGAHARTRRARGKAANYSCTHCGGQAEHWAYDHEDPNELTEMIDGRQARYSANPKHYIPLCVPCHHRFDH